MLTNLKLQGPSFGLGILANVEQHGLLGRRPTLYHWPVSWSKHFHRGLSQANHIMALSAVRKKSV